MYGMKFGTLYIISKARQLSWAMAVVILPLTQPPYTDQCCVYTIIFFKNVMIQPKPGEILSTLGLGSCSFVFRVLTHHKTHLAG